MQWLPGGQAMHAVAPDAHWYLPAEQLEQTLKPLEAVIVPGSQSV